MRLLDSKLLNLLPIDNDTELGPFTNVPPEGVEGKGYILGGTRVKCTPSISVVRLESGQKIIRVNVSVAITKELWSFMRSILTDLTVFYALNAVS